MRVAEPVLAGEGIEAMTHAPFELGVRRQHAAVEHVDRDRVPGAEVPVRAVERQAALVDPVERERDGADFGIRRRRIERDGVAGRRDETAAIHLASGLNATATEHNRSERGGDSAYHFGRSVCDPHCGTGRKWSGRATVAPVTKNTQTVTFARWRPENRLIFCSAPATGFLPLRGGVLP